MEDALLTVGIPAAYTALVVGLVWYARLISKGTRLDHRIARLETGDTNTELAILREERERVERNYARSRILAFIGVISGALMLAAHFL